MNLRGGGGRGGLIETLNNQVSHNPGAPFHSINYQFENAVDRCNSDNTLNVSKILLKNPKFLPLHSLQIFVFPYLHSITHCYSVSNHA